MVYMQECCNIVILTIFDAGKENGTCISVYYVKSDNLLDDFSVFITVFLPRKTGSQDFKNKSNN